MHVAKGFDFHLSFCAVGVWCLFQLKLEINAPGLFSASEDVGKLFY